ncbi:Glycoside-Pentoside-Hexuronide (GPH):Cation Symporter Family, partial [Thraustotheca clavata]
PSSSVVLVQVIGPVTGFLIAPTIGVLSDNCTSKYGRRRPFIFIGAWATALCWLFMMFLEELSHAFGGDSLSAVIQWKTGLIIFMYVWMDISVNLTQVPVNLLIADFAKDRQIAAASIGGVYSIFGSFLISGFVMVTGAATTHFQMFILMLFIVLLVTTMLVCYFVVEHPYIPEFEKRTSQWSQIKEAFTAVYTGLVRLPYKLKLYALLLVLILYGFTAYNSAKGQFFGLQVYEGNATGSDVCGNNCTEAQELYNEGVGLATGLTDTLFNIVGLVYLAFLPSFIRYMGAKSVLAISMIPQVGFIVMAFSRQVGISIFFAVFSSITQNTVFPMMMPLIIHIVGYGESNQLGLFAGALNSAVCFGQFLNFIFSSVLVTSSMGYSLPILVGGLVSLLAFIITLFKFHVDLIAI